MKELKCLMALLCLIFGLCETTLAQEFSQTIRGTIIDEDSQLPLIGATVYLVNQANSTGTTTDADGEFRIKQVPVGRHDIQVNYLGYKPINLKSILVRSGKELVLDLKMQESAVTLEEVKISAENSIDKSRPLNSFASVSSRTFSVEETSRYAAASFDPARMALNFAGVTTGATDDLFNEIIIRGNSSSGVLWRLEGIEIPNPNHFGDMGNSGGAISMLSSSTLSNSDFYTGAFPSEFGNATAGVFDLKMRNGNNEQRETSIMFGALGVELAFEGPINRKSKSSYIFNYRYSTLALLQAAGVNPTGEVLPTYQDLSFKLNFPKRNKGTISIFGLAGNNLAAENPAKDSLEWSSFNEREGFDQRGNMATIGVSYNKLLSNNSYIKTIISGSAEKMTNEDFLLDDNYNETIYQQNEMTQFTGRISSMFHRKINASNSFRLGSIYSLKKFDFSFDEADFSKWSRRTIVNPALNNSLNLDRLFDNTSQTGLLQSYGQWKTTINEKLTVNAGIHFSLLTFNKKYAIEPRGSVSYKVKPNQEITFASGLHSKMENLAIYSFKGKLNNEVINEKKNLGLTKSWHNVIGYDIVFGNKFRIKAEGYYQYLFGVPVRRDQGETFSLLNTRDVWEVFEEKDLVPEGTGTNMGIDLTIEKFFSEGYYFMTTASLYDSKFKTLDNRKFNTRFNGNYQISTLGGKEFKMGRNGKNILGFNGKIVYSGGGRYTPVDLEASRALDDEVRFEDRLFESRTGHYFRTDLGISFRINGKKATHTIMLDVQNVTNRENPAELYYEDETGTLETEDMTGLFPFFNYRLEF